MTYRNSFILKLVLAFWVVPLQAQTSEGFDFSGLSLFWETVEILESDALPTEHEWRRLFDHPGYVQIERSGQRSRVMRSVMPLVFMPSRRAALDSMLSGTEPGLRDRLNRRLGTHLTRVRDKRSDLVAYAKELERSEFVDRGYERALTYLPSDQLGSLEQPKVYVLLFEPNGFGGASVAVDLLNMMELDEDMLLGFIGHELHHAYLGQIDRSRNPDDNDENAGVVHALSALFFEGTASLIDKPMYLDPDRRSRLKGETREFAELFARWFDEAPNMLYQVDSMLTGIATDDLDPATKGRELRQMLPSGGHPTGMFMASAVEQELGHGVLVAIDDPFTFLLRYQDAAVANGMYRFSDTTLDFIRRLRDVYVMR